MLNQIRHSYFILLFAGSVLHASAEGTSSATSAVLIARADKIVAVLGLSDATQLARVRDAVAHEYQDLSVVHAARDAALKAAKELSATDKIAGTAASGRARDDSEKAQDKLHADYLARLAADLTSAQIEQVKDGMTYGVLPLTFRVYNEMLPTLTAEQKAQLLAWLTEAREHAMDASTSQEKHAWFGKYKGRINNYLSKAGIDMKQAEKELMARTKADAK